MTARPIVIIPARGGSERIYRKNLAVVGDRTLLGQAIREAHERRLVVYVSSDDPEILAHARACGALTDERPPVDGDQTVLEAAADAWVRIVARSAPPGAQAASCDRPVLIWQPTVIRAGLLLDWTRDLVGTTLTPPCYEATDHALGAAVFAPVVVGEAHARYTRDGRPLHRLPRSNDEPTVTFRETGLALVDGRWLFDAAFGARHELRDPPSTRLITSRLVEHETIDVDWPHDLDAARSILRPRYRIAFVGLVGPGYGIGHRRRVETLAAELGWHEVDVYWTDQPNRVPPELVDAPDVYDLIVWDALDLGAETLDVLTRGTPQVGRAVVGFETPRVDHPRLICVIDELARPSNPDMHSSTGPAWATIPAAMRALPPKPMHRPVLQRPRIVATFGGQDPAGYSDQAARAFAEIVGPDPDPDLTPLLRIIAGPEATIGLDPDLWARRGIEVVTDAVMVDELRRADVAVTSAGRTVHEAWACGTPTRIVPANDRERARCGYQFYDSVAAAVAAAVDAARDYERCRADGERFRYYTTGSTDRVVGRLIEAAATARARATRETT